MLSIAKFTLYFDYKSWLFFLKFGGDLSGKFRRRLETETTWLDLERPIRLSRLITAATLRSTATPRRREKKHNHCSSLPASAAGPGSVTWDKVTCRRRQRFVRWLNASNIIVTCSRRTMQELLLKSPTFPALPWRLAPPIKLRRSISCREEAVAKDRASGYD